MRTRPSPLTPPTLRADLPLYPLQLQLLRVTAATVLGPSGGSSSGAGTGDVPPAVLYVASTQQLRTDTLAPRDREPCLVTDVNNAGLVAGYYLGRLAGSYQSLPVYEVVALPLGGVGGGSSGVPGVPGLLPGLTAAQLRTLNASLTPTQLGNLNNLTACQLQALIQLPIVNIGIVSGSMTPAALSHLIDDASGSQLVNLVTTLTPDQSVALGTALTANQVQQLTSVLTPLQVQVLLANLTTGQLQTLTSYQPVTIQTMVATFPTPLLRTILSIVPTPTNPIITIPAGGSLRTANGSTVTFDPGTIITGVSTSSPLTTKGDLYTFGAVNARLPVGVQNYDVLVADSTQTLGLRYGRAPVDLSITGNPVLSGGANSLVKVDATGTVLAAIATGVGVLTASSIGGAAVFAPPAASDLTGTVPFANLQGLSSTVFGNLLAATVALSSTNYFGPGDTTTTTTETAARNVVPYAATVQKLYLRTSTAQPVTGNLVFTVLKNGTATGITFTVAAGAVAGLFSDVTHSETVSAGDEISVQVVNNGLALSAAIQGWSLEIDRTG